MASMTHNLVSLITRFQEERVIGRGASGLVAFHKLSDVLERSLALVVAHMATIGDVLGFPWDRSAQKVLKTM
ncbi:MAG: hypothetical protein AAF708_14960 [Deinococcota bacterium]